MNLYDCFCCVRKIVFISILIAAPYSMSAEADVTLDGVVITESQFTIDKIQQKKNTGLSNINKPQTSLAETLPPKLPVTGSSLSYNNAPNSANSMLRAFLGLLTVVGLILLLAYVAKKLAGHKYNLNNNMKIISTLPLSTKEKLLLVEVCGTKILLGVGAAGISKISDIDTHKTEDSLTHSVQEMSVKQKIGVLKRAVEMKRRHQTEQFYEGKNLTSFKCQLSAKNESDFSRKLKDFISGPKQPGCK